LRFIETVGFSRRLLELLDDDGYRAMQAALLVNPGRGAVIAGSGGLRKLRWGLPGRGKRGALRVIYSWDAPAETIFLLLLYTKQEEEAPTRDELRFLARLMKEDEA
jgi:hypothetical protein